MRPIIRLIPYGGVTPMAIVRQMEGRIRTAQDEGGELVGVMACVIEKSPRGNNTYTTTCSPMPVEVALMACNQLKQATLSSAEYEGPENGPDKITG